jgi:serine/threonine protein kinase
MEERRDCLDDATLAAIADGGLSPEERAPIERHLVACDACQGLLAAIVRSLREESSTSGVRHGKTIDRYVVQRWLGSGAAGSVYEAYDPVLDRRVAIKILGAPAVSLEDENAAGRTIDEATLREARAMARLSHPNVVPVHDVGIAGRGAFLVMERVDGTTLRAWLGEQPRDWRAIVEAFGQAGRGLAAAHAAGLVHRDFKPDNALVAPNGRVLVTDFGLSRAYDAPAPGDEPKGPRAGSTGAPLATTRAGGTPAYMAPEQRAGARATPLSDQYAF